MRRRIAGVMIVMTVAALLVVLIPAFFALRSSAAHAQEVELQIEAFMAVREFEAYGTVAKFDEHLISLYSSDGALLAGDGPTSPDAPTRNALAGTPDMATDAKHVIAAIPMSNGSVLRIAEDLRESEDEALANVSLLGAAALGIACLSLVLATRLSRRLGAPLDDLAASAARLGDDDNDDDTSPTRSGIVEIDRIAEALRASSVRVSTLLRRERRLTAYTSHQLRTPLAGMRLAVESEILRPHADPNQLLNDLLHAIDRVDNVVENLISSYQGMPSQHEQTEVVAAVHAAVARWDAMFEAKGRSITTATEDIHVVHARSGTVDTVLDVLIENALHHGLGHVRISVEHAQDTVLIGVHDEGDVDDATTEPELFRSKRQDAHGIGLTLARTLAQAEGARVELISRHPTQFSFIVPSPPPDDGPDV